LQDSLDDEYQGKGSDFWFYGKSSFGDKWGSTFGGFLVAGYDFSKRLNVPARTEQEYAAFTKAKAVSDMWGDKLEQSYSIQTMFANYDINTGTKFTPYAGRRYGGIHQGERQCARLEF